MAIKKASTDAVVVSAPAELSNQKTLVAKSDDNQILEAYNMTPASQASSFSVIPSVSWLSIRAAVKLCSFFPSSRC